MRSMVKQTAFLVIKSISMHGTAEKLDGGDLKVSKLHSPAIHQNILAAQTHQMHAAVARGPRQRCARGVVMRLSEDLLACEREQEKPQ